jgi:hypothetical protein
MSNAAAFQPLFHEACQGPGRLGRILDASSPGRDVSDLHREDAACGMFLAT